MSVLSAEQVQALIRQGVPMAEDIALCIDRLDAEHALARVPFQARLVRRSAIKEIRNTAPIRSKKPMAIKRGL